MTRIPFRAYSEYSIYRSIPTRWIDNDVFGHVNNVIYYAWFDTAVCGHLMELGLLDPLEGSVIGLVVETGCRYARPISFPDVVTAGVRIAHLGSSSVRYEIGLFTEDAEAAAAEGHFVHVYVDREQRRPQPLSGAWRSALAPMMASGALG